MRDSSNAESVSCMRKLLDVGEPGVAASACASKARIAEKLELGLAGRLAGLRPQDSDVWVFVLGFFGYFL